MFDARANAWTVNLMTSENTRFGVYYRKQRAGGDAVNKLLPSTNHGLRLGAFAYSPLKGSKKADLPSSGEAYYSGSTIAQDQSDKFNIYMGTIEITVRFRSSRVSGLISGLANAEGEAYTSGFGTVERIILPNATVMSNGSWTIDTDTSMAQIIYVPQPGSPRPTHRASLLQGPAGRRGRRRRHRSHRHLGPGSPEDDTDTTTGNGEDESVADTNGIRGSFGAERGDALVTTPPSFDDEGANAKTIGRRRDGAGWQPA